MGVLKGMFSLFFWTGIMGSIALHIFDNYIFY